MKWSAYINVHSRKKVQNNSTKLRVKHTKEENPLLLESHYFLCQPTFGKL